jgi:hypothetical protein
MTAEVADQWLAAWEAEARQRGLDPRAATVLGWRGGLDRGAASYAANLDTDMLVKNAAGQRNGRGAEHGWTDTRPAEGGSG